jgi:hypothetical protein
MPHQRQVIRQAVRDLLVAADTGAADRVYGSRKLPWRNLDLPVLNVLTPDEESDDQGTAPRELTRKLTLVIEGWVTANEYVDDAMDALAYQVEQAMHADPDLGDAAVDLVLVSTDTQVGIEGDRQMGLVELTYLVTYRTLAPEPENDDDMDDFDTAVTDYDENGVARDVVEVSE